ncbi:unnamed protein product [Adineta ricciae]|uniref:Uncharacterized protein n=1 Tax=Adineta ricciae TaxID=249248 RepID=A0A815YDI0_ADIRI|nr:unnamed protein product [Adineta ricciae]
MPKSPKVSRKDLQNFVQKIKYFNRAMNYQDNTMQYDSDDDDNAGDHRINQVTSDLTVISDQEADPRLICIAQYFGVENNLIGSARTFKPSVIYLYNFMYETWHLIRTHPWQNIYSCPAQSFQRLDPLKSESDPVQIFSISAQFSPIPTGSDRFLAAGTDRAIITQIRSDPASDLLTWARSINSFHRTHQSTGKQPLS